MKIQHKQASKFELNPLKEVIGQINFERNLEIDKDLPSDFQKRVHKAFPKLETQEPFSVTFDLNSGDPQMAKHVKEPTLYHFISEDRVSRITLSSTYIACSTQRYSKWDDFFKTFKWAIEQLNESYDITNFVRAGLRYRNVISRKELSHPETLWSELLNKQVLGHLYLNGLVAEPIDESCLIGQMSISTLKMASYNVQIQTGFADNEGEKCFFIDNDFYNTFVKNKSAFNTENEMRELHQDAESIFRHFISERLATILSTKS